MKNLIMKILPPALRRWLRYMYLSKQVLEDTGNGERELELLPKLLGQGDFVIDIGANVGIYTKACSSLVGNGGQIYSFEPLRDNLEILKKVIRDGNLSNIRLFHAALGEQAGMQDMVIPELGGFVGYYWAHLATPDESGKRETTEVLTLDGLYNSREIERVDFVKCDVEGGELDVLLGGRELLKAQLPAMLVEVSKQTSEKVFQELKSFGYQPFVYNATLTKTETFRDKEFSNYFFIHPESKIWERVIHLMK